MTDFFDMQPAIPTALTFSTIPTTIVAAAVKPYLTLPTLVAACAAADYSRIPAGQSERVDSDRLLHHRLHLHDPGGAVAATVDAASCMNVASLLARDCVLIRQWLFVHGSWL